MFTIYHYAEPFYEYHWYAPPHLFILYTFCTVNCYDEITGFSSDIQGYVQRQNNSIYIFRLYVHKLLNKLSILLVFHHGELRCGQDTSLCLY
jgi:hypothetical protein